MGLVADLMRELRLKAVQPRTYKRTTVPGEQPVELPDLIGRDLDPASTAPGLRFVGDITYLKTDQGWLYLATVIDLATRRIVVGWQITDHMRTSLITRTMAVDARHAPPGAVFHSDRDAQYVSRAYITFAAEHAVATSVGATGVCWDCETAVRHPGGLTRAMTGPCVPWR